MLPLLLATIAFLLIAFAMFSIRILFVKEGQFRGTCANNNSFLQKEGAVCGVCGRQAGEPCKGDDVEFVEIK